jgi:hypothetical protein
MSHAIQPHATTSHAAPAVAPDTSKPPPVDNAEVKTTVQQITGDMVARESVAASPGAQGTAPSGQAGGSDMDAMVNVFVTQMMVNQVTSQAPPPTTNIDMNSSNPFGGAFADPFGAGNDEQEEEDAAEEEAKRG